jgi:hypothetical protein
MEAKKYALVYQGGIANVFEVETLNLASSGRNAKRIMQSDFRTCETFCRGLAYAGEIIHSAYCNEAGDIKNRPWKAELEDAPFSVEFNPVFNKVVTDSYLSFQGYKEEMESYR